MNAPQVLTSAVGPFPCPFCEGIFAPVAKWPAVAHSWPPCKEFRALHPIEFLKAANAKLAGDRAGQN